jgi:hypothetical protein
MLPTLFFSLPPVASVRTCRLLYISIDIDYGKTSEDRSGRERGKHQAMARAGLAENSGFTKRTCGNTPIDKRANHLFLAREGLVPLEPMNERESTPEQYRMQDLYKIYTQLRFNL